MSKVNIHKNICNLLHETYVDKNNDYGDSYSKLSREYPEQILIRLTDKLERLKSLYSGKEQRVKDESIKDTLLDLANYSILEIIELTEMDCENRK